jgi:hypothetical protein
MSFAHTDLNEELTHPMIGFGVMHSSSAIKNCRLNLFSGNDIIYQYNQSS